MSQISALADQLNSSMSSVGNAAYERRLISADQGLYSIMHLFTNIETACGEQEQRRDAVGVLRAAGPLPCSRGCGGRASTAQPASRSASGSVAHAAILAYSDYCCFVCCRAAHANQFDSSRSGG
jgi:hypothetical protein